MTTDSQKFPSYLPLVKMDDIFVIGIKRSVPYNPLHVLGTRRSEGELQRGEEEQGDAGQEVYRATGAS